MRSIRQAVTFDDDLYSYLSEVAKTRKESFSKVCGSLLREIMRDDREAEVRVPH